MRDNRDKVIATITTRNVFVASRGNDNNYYKYYSFNDNNLFDYCVSGVNFNLLTDTPFARWHETTVHQSWETYDI